MKQKTTEISKKSNKNILPQLNNSNKTDDVELLFNSFNKNDGKHIEVKELLRSLDKNGILKDDPRLNSFISGLEKEVNNKQKISIEEFRSTTKECFSLIVYVLL